MEQNQLTPEWYVQRRYKFTSSSIYKLMTEPKSKAAKEAGELSETAKTYIMEKIAEEMGGFIPEINAKAMEWGIENEPLAKQWYTAQTGNEIKNTGFIEHIPFYGGSPDGTVFDNGQKGAIEIKCPYNSVNHFWNCMIKDAGALKSDHPEYYWQCISHIICLSVEWCDFVSFDPRIDHAVGLHIFRLNRNEEDCNLVLHKIKTAIQYKEYLKQELGLLK